MVNQWVVAPAWADGIPEGRTAVVARAYNHGLSGDPHWVLWSPTEDGLAWHAATVPADTCELLPDMIWLEQLAATHGLVLDA